MLLKFTTTFGTICVIALSVFFLYANNRMRDFRRDHPTPFLFVLLLVFGLLSIYGTLSAVTVEDAYCNVRDLAPLLGGLLGGPIVGIGAGLVGGLFRLTAGGPTMVPCAISCLISGAVGSFVFVYGKGKVVSPLVGLATAGLIECVHMLLVAAFGYINIAFELIGPMVVATSVGAWFGLTVYHYLNDKR